MSKLQNDRFLKALKQEAVNKVPMWMMRQAGRYLPEYRATRAIAGDFLTLCKTPELACEVTLQPLRRFDFDAAIIFSDILTIPDAMGLGLYFSEGEGPKFTMPISNPQQLYELQGPDVATALSYVADAIMLTKSKLQQSVPLIGFTGSPWTLACYIVEGGSSKDFKKIKTWMYAQPEAIHHLLGVLADAVTQYLLMQIKAGADALMIFDTWGGLLSAKTYEDFSLSYVRKIIAAVKADPLAHDIPIVLFTKNGGLWLDAMADSGCDGVGLDWTIDLGAAQRIIKGRVAMQGNLDPMMLYAPPSKIRDEVARLFASLEHTRGYVFNLGHGILPDIPVPHVEALVAAVREFG